MSEQILRSVSLCRNGAVQPEGYGTTLVFGCAGNRGVYRVGVVQEDEWTGLTVQAHWHVPGGKDPPASLVENGEVAVPALVTAVPGEGCITFEGTDGAGVTVVSADVEYRVAGNTGTGEGTMPEPETPAWEAFVKLVLDDKVEDVIQLATTSAEKTAADAAKAEAAAGKAEKNAAKAQAAQREVSTEHGTAMTEIATAKKDALDKIETARTTAVEQAQAAAEKATGAANKAGEAARSAQTAKNEAEQALGSIRTDGPAAVKAIADAKSGAVQQIATAKTGALEEVETATESAQQAAQAAQAAERNAALKASSAETNASLARTAKENAQGSASNARASENASKEYLKKIQTIAQGAQGWYATPTALQNAVPSGQNGWWAIVGTTDSIWVWDSDSGTRGAWVESAANAAMTALKKAADSGAFKGDKGDTGPKGDAGAQGPTGPKGDTGATGPKGDKGDTGPKGDTGATGPRGAIGATGPQGPAGTSAVASSGTGWVRFSDGTQMCWGSSTMKYGDSVSITFPQAFKSTPSVTATYTEGDDMNICYSATRTATAATFHKYKISGSSVVGATYAFCWTAVGRWK